MNQQDSNEPQHNPYKIQMLYRKTSAGLFEAIVGQDVVYGDPHSYAFQLFKEISELEAKISQMKEAILDLFVTDQLPEQWRTDIAQFLYYYDNEIAASDIAAVLGCDVDAIHEVIGGCRVTAACAGCGGAVPITIYHRNEIDPKSYETGDLRFATSTCSECDEARQLTTRDPETLRKMPYADYLKTDHWKETRQGALKRAGYRCQLCNAKGALHVHHRTYERRGSEIASDLLVLCADCHKTFHDNHKVVKG